ncbi:hypothetical protein KP509_06G065300 [Ceratopteris richardii]|uniref:RING-type E3 ubiquitin transferase n=1 Tax=Ceratopteris richardii TaxID=49495 RepID=A0A8T2UJ21_CERRI|nr:hypothetical protein KP509_06G065300 [Ceratopteris richardii]
MAQPQSASALDAPTSSSPLLESSEHDGRGRSPTARRRTISRVFNLIRRRAGRRLLRDPSVAVREAAAEQLEDRQSEWAYSKPIVILDLVWNLTFVAVSMVVLLLSIHERPSNPLRIWVLGYALQCCVHVSCVWFEYMRRHSRRGQHYLSGAPRYSSNEGDFSDSEQYVDHHFNQDFDTETFSRISLAKRIESANTSLSFVWWILGFYWSTTGDQSQNAPLLFWLCAAFLAFDVFFVVFCVSLACIIGVAVCCCLPCIIALMYAVAEQEGASEEDINMLPKFKFRRTGSFNKTGPCGGILTNLQSVPGTIDEHFLPAEDAECCICLSSYDDDIEIRELYCRHHFHSACIDRWLRMNSTCPLCKFDIVKDRCSRRYEGA